MSFGKANYLCLVLLIMVKIEKSYFEGEKCQIALKTQNLGWFLQFHRALDDLRLNQLVAKFK